MRRSLLMGLLPWILVGTIPRMMGIMVSKPQYVKSLLIADVIVVIIVVSILLSVVYSAYRKYKSQDVVNDRKDQNILS